MIYHVKRLHFETNYYIQYEDAGNVYRVPVVLYEKGNLNAQHAEENYSRYFAFLSPQKMGFDILCK